MIEEKVLPFEAMLAKSGRLIGFDHGAKRIGLAITDTLRTVATPYSIVQTKPQDKIFTAMDEIMHDEEIAGMVIGLPLHMSGQESERSHKAREFASLMFEHYHLPILLFDERLTTAAVERMLVKEADLSRQKRKKHRDKLAACILLQTLCDALLQSRST